MKRLIENLIHQGYPSEISLKGALPETQGLIEKYLTKKQQMLENRA